jgi:hypothetical protein
MASLLYCCSYIGLDLTADAMPNVRPEEHLFYAEDLIRIWEIGVSVVLLKKKIVTMQVETA